MLISATKEQILTKKSINILTEARDGYSWKAIIAEFSIEKSGRAHGSFNIISTNGDNRRCVMLNKAIKFYNSIKLT